jgi:gliding motility-associated-like protein
MINKATTATDASFRTGNDHCNQGIGFLQVNNVTGGTAPYTFSVDSIIFVNGIINNLPTDNYNLFVKDSNGCVLKKGPVAIGNETGPAAIDFTTTQAYCGELTGNIKVNEVQGGSSPYIYSIDGNGYVTSSVFTGILPGNHDLYVKDAYGCIHSQRLQVEHKPIAKINLLPADTTVCYDEILSLSLTGDISQVSGVIWNIPSQGVSALLKASEEKKVFVTITDNNNCIIRNTSIVKVKACNPSEKCIAIPTAFTPNNDGKNETLGPITNGCRVESISFQVYNRWSELVFETNKPGTGWNGIYKGIPQPADVYVFICKYVAEDRISRQQKGTFMLIR